MLKIFSSLFLVFGVFQCSWAAQQDSPQAEISAVETAADYLIGPGDLLDVQIYGTPDMSRQVRVSAKGFIRMPLLPRPVRADRRTPAELALELARLYEEHQILRDPEISILVKEFKSRPVAVVGAVNDPQMVPVLGPTNLLQVLSETGGLAENAGNYIYVTRGARLRALPDEPLRPENSTLPDSDTIVIDVRDLMVMRDPAANVPVYAGDLVTVPRAGIVYVVGAVNKPGGFLLRNRREQLTVLQAVALAENMTGTARPGHALIIRRPPGTDKEETIEVDVAAIMARQEPDRSLEDNDILFIPDSPIKKGLARAAQAAIQIATGVAIWRGR